MSSILWSPVDAIINGQMTQGSPAMAMFNGTLYMIHHGFSSDNTLWVSTWNPTEQIWNANVQILDADGNTISCTGMPALVVFNNTLYCMCNNNNANVNAYQLQSTSTNGVNWSNVFALDASIGASPACIVYQNLLFLFYKSNGKGSLSYNELMFKTMDADGNWTTEIPVPGATGTSKDPGRGTCGAVGLAIFDNQIYIAHEGTTIADNGNGKIYLQTYDGTNWSDTVQLNSANGTSGCPSLATFGGMLNCFHEGSGQSGALWLNQFDGVSWTVDTRMTNTNTPLVSTGAPGTGVYSSNIMFAIHEGNNRNGQLWYFTGTTA